MRATRDLEINPRHFRRINDDTAFLAKLIKDLLKIRDTTDTQVLRKMFEELTKQGEKLMADMESVKVAAADVAAKVAAMKEVSDRTEMAISDVKDKIDVAIDILKTRSGDPAAMQELEDTLKGASATLAGETAELGAKATELDEAAMKLSDASGSEEVSGGPTG